VDLEGLRAIVRFCIENGAHGLVAPANASEQPYLTDEERRIVTRTVIEETGGRAAVVAGVTASTAPIAAELAHGHRQLAEAGAHFAAVGGTERTITP
jgi:4-hydroxy-tetrahydrodipicolinate synthase